MRRILQILISLVLILGAFFAMNKIASLGDKKRPKPKKVIKTVFVDTVKNGVVPIKITATGNLIAQRRLDLYAEVQGVMVTGSKLFKPGQVFKKGEYLLQLDASEFNATVQAQKSNLINQIVAALPDLRLDYPAVFEKWEAYVNSINVNKPLPKLPVIQSDKEKYFVTGKNIFSTYYAVKNLEQRLSKYALSAPFTGILTQANVTEGALVRNGQKLGEFIQTGSYELPVAIHKAYADLLNVGATVLLKNQDSSKEYKGVIQRINGNIDPSSQMINAYVAVNDTNLREGMYLEAQLNAKDETNAIEVDRAVLQSSNKLFVVRDSILDVIDVKPVYFSATKAVIKGVPNGVLMVNKPVPGAYAGMRVKIYEEAKAIQSKNEANLNKE